MDNETTNRKRTRDGAAPARKMQEASKLRKLVQIAMLGAVAAVLMIFEFPLPIAPPFYKLDLSELPVLIGAFAMGPLAGMAIELVKILLNLVMDGSTTMFVGELANFVMGCALIVPAGIIYRMRKDKKHAMIGMGVGVILMTVTSVLMNAYVMLPLYSKAFMPLDTIIAAGSKIYPAVTNLLTFCVLIVAPFNLIKGVVISIITAVIYKYISRILKH